MLAFISAVETSRSVFYDLCMPLNQHIISQDGGHVMEGSYDNIARKLFHETNFDCYYVCLHVHLNSPSPTSDRQRAA